MAVDTPTLEQVLSLTRKLPPRERTRLIALIAQDLTAEPLPIPTVGDQLDDDRRSRDATLLGGPGTAATLLAYAGAWEGDDLDERLAQVYATRQPVEE